MTLDRSLAFVARVLVYFVSALVGVLLGVTIAGIALTLAGRVDFSIHYEFTPDAE